MEDSILIIIIIVFIYIFLYLNKSSLTFVESSSTGIKYLVQNDEDKKDTSKLLGEVVFRMYKLRDHLSITKELHSEFKLYIEQLERNFNESRTSIYENKKGSKYTSYSVNKGEEIVFCLKSKNTQKNHDINLIMYVAIHEMAHLACPEVGHTPLFNKIFKFFINQAVEKGFYKYKNYGNNPTEYCGMILTSNIL